MIASGQRPVRVIRTRTLNLLAIVVPAIADALKIVRRGLTSVLRWHQDRRIPTDAIGGVYCELDAGARRASRGWSATSTTTRPALEIRHDGDGALSTASPQEWSSVPDPLGRRWPPWLRSISRRADPFMGDGEPSRVGRDAAPSASKSMRTLLRSRQSGEPGSATRTGWSMNSPAHEWTKREREGWSVCSRCGMVRNYDRETTTCKRRVAEDPAAQRDRGLRPG